MYRWFQQAKSYRNNLCLTATYFLFAQKMFKAFNPATLKTLTIVSVAIYRSFSTHCNGHRFDQKVYAMFFIIVCSNKAQFRHFPGTRIDSVNIIMVDIAQTALFLSGTYDTRVYFSWNLKRLD